MIIAIGMFYYEATVTDEGLCRVGWATDLASLDLGKFILMTDNSKMSTVPPKKLSKTLINWAVNLNEEWLETDKCVFTMKVLAWVP